MYASSSDFEQHFKPMIAVDNRFSRLQGAVGSGSDAQDASYTGQVLIFVALIIVNEETLQGHVCHIDFQVNA